MGILRASSKIWPVAITMPEMQLSSISLNRMP
ncbi:unnamed protein product [Linum tenue]|uniref:Uncharacterized protein n=1 Tax=Linum tenue TaxID=586396 RepID=A0AAV0LWE7_9ROSI|nr:unnamed protein product [Linum tenue]